MTNSSPTQKNAYISCHLSDLGGSHPTRPRLVSTMCSAVCLYHESSDQPQYRNNTGHVSSTTSNLEVKCRRRRIQHDGKDVGPAVLYVVGSLESVGGANTLVHFVLTSNVPE